MAVIDTNVFVYAILEDSEFHREARRILSSLKKWTVPSIVIYELWWFLRFSRFSSDKIELAISSILNSPRSRIIAFMATKRLGRRKDVDSRENFFNFSFII